MTEFRITFCTVSMNRLHHIRQTLVRNILGNEDYRNCEFLLLDYNSTDGLEEYVKNNLHEFIESEKLIYYKMLIPKYFHRAHARNTAFKLSKGHIICNVDADNFVGEGFAFYINEIFSKNDSCFLTADLTLFVGDVGGRVCLKRGDFFLIGGYDEKMDCWGHEDDDLKNRLSLIGLTKKYIQNPQFLNVIIHGDEDRLANEFARKFLKRIFLCQLTLSCTHVLLIFDDQSFQNIALVDNMSLNSENFNNAIYPPVYDYYQDINEEKCFYGQWCDGADKNEIKLITSKKEILKFKKVGKVFQLRYSNDAYNYCEMWDQKLIEEILIIYSFAKNRLKLKENMTRNLIKVNDTNIGKGTVYKNFDYDNPIEL